MLIIGFSGNISEKIARSLEDFGRVIYLKSDKTTIDAFVARTDFGGEYSHVLGLGMYSGKDKDSIRIEATCSKRFRNNGSGLQKLSIPYFFTPASNLT